MKFFYGIRKISENSSTSTPYVWCPHCKENKMEVLTDFGAEYFYCYICRLVYAIYLRRITIGKFLEQNFHTACDIRSVGQSVTKDNYVQVNKLIKAISKKRKI